MALTLGRMRKSKSLAASTSGNQRVRRQAEWAGPRGSDVGFDKARLDKHRWVLDGTTRKSAYGGDPTHQPSSVGQTVILRSSICETSVRPCETDCLLAVCCNLPTDSLGLFGSYHSRILTNPTTVRLSLSLVAPNTWTLHYRTSPRIESMRSDLRFHRQSGYREPDHRLYTHNSSYRRPPIPADG